MEDKQILESFWWHSEEALSDVHFGYYSDLSASYIEGKILSMLAHRREKIQSL